ncbi:MAG: hypothetical protein WD472_06265 [Dehalococcoidia bacterium]
MRRRIISSTIAAIVTLLIMAVLVLGWSQLLPEPAVFCANPAPCSEED